MPDYNALQNVRLVLNSKPLLPFRLSTDWEKADYAVRGIRRPSPSSAWALGLYNLAWAAWNVPTPPPTPDPLPPPIPPSSALSPIWLRSGVYARTLANFPGPLRQAARVAGFSWLAVQVTNAPYAHDNLDEISLIGNKLKQEGWSLVGWGTAGQGTSPEADSTEAADVCRALGLSGYCVNLEAWAENAGYWKSQAFVDSWTSPCPLAVSCLSSDTGNYARNFDYPAFLKVPGCAIMPQAYSVSAPTYTVAAMRANLAKAGVPLSRVAPTFEVVAGQGNIADYRTWAGPRSVFAADDSSVGFWQAMAR